ncbi:extended synaptotagmin-3-like [Cylas formicarius]|uniref:extended synaptotagmin-3-like n=1 Tax=Cylas formicarius TaxID=197179 RepID=UPI0029584906|nr:extended synaptotagmin-3-like [Cylas formicarius]
MEIIHGTDILSKGKIKLTLRYSVQRQTLVVTVHHIEDLHFDDTKSVYVKIYILPERHKETKRKTKIVKTSKNPVFDETFEYAIPQDEFDSKQLEVLVVEERLVGHHPIEKVLIDLDKLGLVLPYTRLFRLSKTH